MATPTNPSSRSLRAGSGPVIDAEWRELTEAERAALPPPRASVGGSQAVVRLRTTAPATAGGSARRCPLCGESNHQLIPVRVFGALNVRLCGRCAAVGYTASMVLGRLLG